MGLDQWAGYYTEAKDEEGDSIMEYAAEWRKHPNLQGFMENLYNEKGGTETFNTPAKVELVLKDIDALEEAVKNASLPETGGFFFGSDADEHYEEEDLQFCEYARKLLAEGKTIYYSSWW